MGWRQGLGTREIKGRTGTDGVREAGEERPGNGSSQRAESGREITLNANF